MGQRCNIDRWLEQNLANYGGRVMATILLVVRDIQVSELIRTVLTEAGHIVLVAGNQEVARQTCRTHQGDIGLLIASWAAAPLTGLGIARQMVYTRPSMKVLIISGYMVDAEVRSTGAGFLGTPFNPFALISKVSALLAAPQRFVAAD